MVLILFFVIVTISGCMGESVTEGVVGDSNFEIEGDWDQTFITNKGPLKDGQASKTRYSEGGISLEFIITQYGSKKMYESELKKIKENYGTINFTISGIPVIEVEDAQNTPVYIYFFEKGGKYYTIQIYDRYAKNYLAAPESHKETTVKPINKIIQTIK